MNQKEFNAILANFDETFEKVAKIGSPAQLQKFLNRLKTFNGETKQVPSENLQKLMIDRVVNHIEVAKCTIIDDDKERLDLILGYDNSGNIFHELFRKAIQTSNWEMFVFLKDHRFRSYSDFLLDVLSEGKADFYFRLVGLGFSIQQKDFWAAFKGGSVPIINDLLEKGLVITDSCVRSVVFSDNLEALKICLNHKTVSVSKLLNYTICSSNSIKIAEYLASLLTEVSWVERLALSSQYKPEMIRWLLAKLDESPSKIVTILLDRLRGNKIISRDSPIFEILEQNYKIEEIPRQSRYTNRKEVLKGRRRFHLMKRYGRIWFEKWYNKSANPDGNGIVYRRWKEKLSELLSL